MEHYLPSDVLGTWLHSIGMQEVPFPKNKGQESTHLYPWDHETQYYAKPKSNNVRPGVPPHTNPSYFQAAKQAGVLPPDADNLRDHVFSKISKKWWLPPSPEQAFKAANEFAAAKGQPPLPAGFRVPVSRQLELLETQGERFQWIRYSSTLLFVAAVSPYSFTCPRSMASMRYPAASVDNLQYRPTAAQGLFDQAHQLLGGASHVALPPPRPSLSIREVTDGGHVCSPTPSLAGSTALHVIDASPHSARPDRLVLSASAAATAATPQIPSIPAPAAPAADDGVQAMLRHLQQQMKQLQAENKALKEAQHSHSVQDSGAAAAAAAAGPQDEINSPGPAPTVGGKRPLVIQDEGSPAQGTRAKKTKPAARTQPPKGTKCKSGVSPSCVGVSQGGKGPKKWILSKEICEACNTYERTHATSQGEPARSEAF